MSTPGESRAVVVAHNLRGLVGDLLVFASESIALASDEDALGVADQALAP